MIQDALNFDPLMIESYGDITQDVGAITTIEDDGVTLKLVGNGWKKINFDYTITADTILEFSFKSSQEGEIHGIGLDNNNMVDSNSLFKLYGTQNWGIRDFDTYQDPTGETWIDYKIPVGAYLTGEISYLTFANDHDVSNSEIESIFSNIRIYENQALTASDDGSVDNTTVTVPVDSSVSNNSNYVQSSNIIKNGTFSISNTENVFNSNTGTTYSTDAGKGWTVPLNHKWNFDGINQWANANNSGAGGLIQVIADNQLTQGLKGISFDATNIGSNNQLRLQVYGIDGEFKIGNWKTNAPISLDDSPINVVTLLDTNNVATEQFDWTTFSWDSVDFGSGYEYIAVRFWTNGVEGTEYQAIDNVFIESLDINSPPLAFDDIFTTQQNTSITISIANLLSNDNDPNGDNLSLVSVDNNINGTVYLDDNGNIIFTPNIDFLGTASFDYTVSDGNGGIDAATVRLDVEHSPSDNVNIINNGTFTTINNEDIFTSNWGATYSTDAGKGWTIPSERKWNFNEVNGWANADNDGAGALIQVIADNQMTQGLQAISFDATNIGSNNTLQLQVYGVDGEFNISNWNTNAPIGLDGSSIDVVTLLDTNNVATEQFDWTTFSWDSIDFGSGYEYIAVRFWTDGVNDSEFQAIDNVMIGSLPENTHTPPTAYDDYFVTQKNHSLTILGSELLANDVDYNDQILKITEVNNASNGTVSLNSQGNIFFSPDPDFVGFTSFNYTIQNEQGSLGYGTVNINVPSPVALGTNLATIGEWVPQLPFTNHFKFSRPWITQTNGVWDTRESDLLDLDESGWVKSLPVPEDGTQYTYVTTVLSNLNPGRYIVLYEGEGEIEYRLTGEIDETTSVHGRDVVDVVSEGNFQIAITQTDPSQIGDYIRNIQVIPEAYESISQTETFNPTFIQKTEPYHAVRFMDWMKTNGSTQQEWSERPTLEDPTWSESGAPVEVMVELANTLDIDPWFTIPHLATDEYVTNFATYVRDNLESERTVYVEYSNETWNGQFAQTRWIQQQVRNDTNFNGNEMNWFGKRTTEITQIWDQVFDQSGQKERVIGVMGAQAANYGTAQNALDYDSWSTENKTHADYGIDAIAIAPYFGSYLGKRQHEAEVETWTVDQLFDELTKGGVLRDSPVGGALQQSYKWMETYANLAKQEGLELLAYEGGQHLVGIKNVNQNQAINDLFIEANRDPRMGELYKEYFSNWYQQGGGLFMNYNDVGTPSKWGSWGTLEHIDQPGSPKYDALMDLIDNGIETSQ